MLPLISHLPEIYDVDAMQASWIITATLLAGALATPVVSRLADMFGKRRLIIIALIIMVAGCLLLALVHAYAVALVGRAMQGVTAAVLPVALSVLKDVMPPERVGSGIAIVSATLGIGSAAGLPLAGLMYGQLGFSSLFWLTGGIAALLALASWRFLPRSAPTGRRERFDLSGAVLLGIALTSLLLVLSQGGEWGWRSGETVVLAIVGRAVPRPLASLGAAHT